MLKDLELDVGSMRKEIRQLVQVDDADVTLAMRKVTLL